VIPLISLEPRTSINWRATRHASAATVNHLRTPWPRRNYHQRDLQAALRRWRFACLELLLLALLACALTISRTTPPAPPLPATIKMSGILLSVDKETAADLHIKALRNP